MSILTQEQREVVIKQAEFIAYQAWNDFIKTSAEAKTPEDADDAEIMAQIAANAATVMHAFRSISG